MSGMRADYRRLLAILVPGVVLALWLVLGAVLGWVMLVPVQKVEMIEAVEPIVESHGLLVFAWWLLLAGLAAWVAARFYASHVAGPARLTDATRALAEDVVAPDLTVGKGGSFDALAEAVNALAAQRRALAVDMERLVVEASRDVAEQRDQLAALMAELEQSVVVCNLEGRILLYNARARGLFRRVLQEKGGKGRCAGQCRHRSWPFRSCPDRPSLYGSCPRRGGATHCAWRGGFFGPVCHYHAGGPSASGEHGRGAPGWRKRCGRP